MRGAWHELLCIFENLRQHQQTNKMKINRLKCDQCQKEQGSNECWPRTNIRKGMISLEYPPTDPIAHPAPWGSTTVQYDLCSPECLALFVNARISEHNSKIHEANMDKCYKLSLWELQLEVMRIRERFAVQSYEASILARAQSIIGRVKHAQTQQSPIEYLQPSNQEPQERLPLSDDCTRSPQ